MTAVLLLAGRSVTFLQVGKYLNRLSDYLFTAARYVVSSSGSLHQCIVKQSGTTTAADGATPMRSFAPWLARWSEKRYSLHAKDFTPIA
jgi:hypothetical protein